MRYDVLIYAHGHWYVVKTGLLWDWARRESLQWQSSGYRTRIEPRSKSNPGSRMKS